MNEKTAPLITCPVCSKESRVYKDKVTDRIFCPFCQFPMDARGPIPLDDITVARFIEMVHKPVMILFWAPWEKESDDMVTLFSLEVETHQDRMILASINIEKNPESKRRYGIELVPTIVIFAFGREINRVIGPIQRFEISRLIQADFF